MKKLFRYLRIAFYSLFYSMRSADKMLATSSTDDELDPNSIGGIEQQQEKKSVYQDLLKGVVTEEVRELRHEMYYAERKSREYQYSGGGTAKKTTMFDYKGNVDKSDGYKIKIVQQNEVIPTSLSDSGVVVYGDKYDVEDNLGTFLRNRTRSEKEYRIKIERENYIPRFRIENYLTKLVVKEVEGDVVMIDLYINKYYNKLEPTSKLFHAEMERIYQGIDMGSEGNDTLKFSEIHFITKNAYGSPDLVELSYKDFSFDTILEYDGHYVLKFFAKENNKHDIVEEFYNEATAKKCENNEMREGATLNMADLFNKEVEKEYDVDEALKLIDKKENHQD